MPVRPPRVLQPRNHVSESAEVVADLLPALARGETLSAAQAEAAVAALVGGEVSDVAIAAFLTALRVRGETADELVGAANALARTASAAFGDDDFVQALDTCGTGGDGTGTFNISTAAAIVCAACGVPVAKHGNRSVSSNSGSADVLAELGVNVDVDLAVARRCLRELGLTFLFAPQWYPAVKAVMPVRRRLGFRTLFNLIGPLANPADAAWQLLGVAEPKWVPVMALAAARRGIVATVVCGSDGLDEVTLAGPTHVCHAKPTAAGPQVVLETTWMPDDFGLPAVCIDDLRTDGPAASASLIRRILAGENLPARHVVVANAAAALWTTGHAADLKAGVAAASAALDDGAARDTLAQLVAATTAV